MEIEGNGWVVVLAIGIVCGLISWGIWAGHDTGVRNGQKEKDMWISCLDHGKDPVTCRVAMRISP